MLMIYIKNLFFRKCRIAYFLAYFSFTKLYAKLGVFHAQPMRKESTEIFKNKTNIQSQKNGVRSIYPV